MDGYLEPMDQIETLAEFFIQQIQSVQPQGPYHLAGPCLGGIIVFEMAQQLIESGEEVSLLGILDSGPPTADSRQISHRTIGSSVKRAISLVLSGQFRLLWKKVKARLRKVKTLFLLWKRIQKTIHKTPHQKFLGHRLDAHSWQVLEKLQVAKNLYNPHPYPGRGLVILSEVEKETPRQQDWAKLLNELECFYIPMTNHGNIFDDERSLDQIAELIDAHIPE